MSDERYKENYAYHKRIVDELEGFYHGGYFKHDGEYYPTHDWDEDFWKKEGCAYRENEYGDMVYVIDDEEIPEDDIEMADLWDYFEKEEILDIKFTVNGDLSYSGVCLMITCGGPNVYIDTDTSKVELYWWGEEAKASFDSDTRNAIDEYWEDYYKSLSGRY